MLLKKPSAWIPLILPFGITLMFFFTVLLQNGPIVRQADEGTEAHIFQIWLALQVLLVGYFGIKWLPKMPKDTLIILGLQIFAALSACFPVFYFKL